jgi:hypothetical protein
MPDTHAYVGKQPVVKISKTAAEYEHPAKGDNHCGICEYFEQIEPDHCSRVRGVIKAEDWCRLFSKQD